MDLIRIRGLKTEALIGVHEWERRLPRILLIDLDLATDAARAAGKDRLEEALDYGAVSQSVIALVAASRVQLIETLAEQLAAMLQNKFGLRWLALTVHKPGAVPAAQDVAVSIERGERGTRA